MLATPSNWTQRVFTDQNDCYCIVGAVMSAQGKAFTQCQRDDTIKFLAIAAHFADREYYDCALFDWNDAPDRTHAEILQLLDTAIALC